MISDFLRHMLLQEKEKVLVQKKIGYELVSRGVNENTASEVIDAEGGWNEAALKAFNKKFKAGIGSDFKEQNKQKVFLQNRGFSFQEIDSVFN